MTSALSRPHTGSSRRHVTLLAVIVTAVVAIAVLALILTRLGNDDAPDLRTGDIATARDVHAFELAEGNCVEALQQVSRDQVRQIPCAAPHLAEVVGELPLDDEGYSFGGRYNERAREFCLPRAYDAIPPDMDPGPLLTEMFVPGLSSWNDGHTTILCLITVGDGHHLTGSFVHGDAELHEEDLP